MMEYNRVEIGKKIRKMRRDMSLTQAAFAESINRTPKFCADIERGSCLMSFDTFTNICNFFNIEASVLLPLKPIPNEKDEDEMVQIANLLTRCTPKQREIILQTLLEFVQKP